MAAGQWPGMDSDDNGGSTSTSSGGPSGATAADMVRVVRTSHYINAHQIPEGSRLIKAKGARVHLIQTPSNDFVFGYVKGHAILDANAPFGSGPNITTYWSQARQHVPFNAFRPGARCSPFMPVAMLTVASVALPLLHRLLRRSPRPLTAAPRGPRSTTSSISTTPTIFSVGT